MNLTEEEIRLFKKYKPIVYYEDMVDTYDETKDCYIRNGHIKISHDVDSYLRIYCIKGIQEAQKKAIKSDKRYIFDEEMKEIING